jgi:hypothetical protein
VNAIQTQPDFAHTETFSNFFLVTDEYNETVTGRIAQSGKCVGLVLDKPTYKIWVKTWGAIVREREARLRFIAEILQF